MGPWSAHPELRWRCGCPVARLHWEVLLCIIWVSQLGQGGCVWRMGHALRVCPLGGGRQALMAMQGVQLKQLLTCWKVRLCLHAVLRSAPAPERQSPKSPYACHSSLTKFE